MPARPDVPYDPVSSISPTTQAPNDYIRTDATPQAFGGQIGEAIQRAGATGEKLGSDVADFALQQQGLINQSLAQNAETQHTTAVDGIVSKYKTLEGLDAVAAHDKALADITAQRQQIMASLPTGGAQRAFAQMALRHEAFAIGDVGNYYSQQVKEASVKSSQAIATNSVAQTGLPNVAADDNRFNYNLQSALYGLNNMMQVRGFSGAMSVDPKTGEATFDASTDAGKQGAAYYKEQRDELVSKAWTNRIHTLADDPTSGNVQTALDVFNSHKDQIPAQAQMELQAYLTPKLRAVNANAAATTAVRGADASYVASIGSPGTSSIADAIHGQESGGRATSVTSVNGAVGGWQIIPTTFQKYAQPGESITNPTDNEAVGRRIINDLSRKFNGDPARIAVGYFSGEGNVAPAGSQTPWIEDKKDGNGKSVSSYVADIRSRLGPASYQVASTSNAIPVPSGGATVVPPPPQTKADYYRTHEADIVESARQTAIMAHPDDPMAADLAASRAQQQVSAIIRQQEVAYKADSDMVYQAANGDLAKGTAPLTVDQLRATSPQVAQAWDRLQAQQPQVAHEVATRLLTENARTNGGDSKTYGPAFSSVFNRIHSDGPDRITDQSQLYSMVGQPGGLTMSGLEKARQEINGKNTPDGEAEAKMREQMFKNAHGALTGKNDGLGLVDPRGEEIYLRFMAAAYPAIEAAKAAGKTPWQIYNPDSPDYVGKVANGMKRTPAQFQADMMSSNGAAPAQAAAASTSYARADLEAEMQRRGLLPKPAAPVAPSGPQVPH